MTDDNQIFQARINGLEKSIADTRKEFIDKIEKMEVELISIRQLASRQVPPSTEQADKKDAAFIQYQDSEDTLSIDRDMPDEAPNNKSVDTHAASQAQTGSASAALSNKHSKTEKRIEPEEIRGYKEEPVEPKEPGFAELMVSHFINSILGWLLNTFTVFKAPFHDLFHRFINLYQHYQKQGKAPVFLMTVAGLITLTFGFGYLLQYSFNSLFNDTLKAVTGFVIGFGIIGSGVLLSVKKTDFQDYAASVIGLGVIFNYLTAYFIGPYYGLVSEPVGFGLLLAATAVSFSLATIFETRIVSAVTMVGGIFMPFIIGSIGSIGLVFLGYLFILSCANLYLSNRIKWPALAQINFILSLSVIEYIGISQSINPIFSITLLSAFFYLYTYYWSFNGVSLKETLSKYDLTLLIANVFYFIYAMLLVPAPPVVLAGVFAFHAVALVLVVRFLHLMQSIMAPMYLLFIGLLFATAVFVVSPADVTSIIWAIQGLAMITVGFRYAHKLIRVEGYTIYVVAMAGLLWQAVNAFIFMSATGIAWHWINLLAFGGLSLLAYRLIYFFKDKATQTELKAAVIQNEIFSFWGALALSLLIAIFLTSSMAVLAFIPMVWSFYRVARHKLLFAQITGFAFLMAYILQIVVGVYTSQSLLISEQPLLSSIAIIELLFFAWGLHFYFNFFELKGRGAKFAHLLHDLVFFAPVVLILLSLYNIFDRHVEKGWPLELNNIWIDFCVIGVLFVVSFWAIKKTEHPKENEAEKHACLIDESLSLFITTFFLYSTSLLTFKWMFPAAVIPMFYLLHRALMKKLPLTEMLAWMHFIILGVGIYLSYLTIGNLHFSAQPWSIKVVLVELLVGGWSMQLMYGRLNAKGVGYALACKLRILVYCLVPLLFLPRILRLYPDYLATALWVSFAISWLMYKKLKIEILLKELTLLFFIATAFTVVISLTVMADTQLARLVSLLVGLTIVTIFHYIEKTLSLTSSAIRHSSYYYLHICSPYLYAFILGGLSYALLNQAMISILFIGLYFLWANQDKRVAAVMRESLTLSYLLSWLFLTTAPLMVFLYSFQYNVIIDNYFIAIVSSLASVGGVWMLTHEGMYVLDLFNKKYFKNNTQYWAFHGVVLVSYLGVLNLLFSPWGVAISIAMLIHAVTLLFLTLSDQYKGLLRLSIALYVLTAFKVLLYDMNDFSNLHKVFALLGIGSILMGAAFMFQKIRNKQL
ncbi:MAG: DUF2339 domain-containing protein [Candidatus Thiodiazotropha sp.]